MQKCICYSTVFALFYFEFGGNFQVQAPGGLFLEGLTGIHGGVYFQNFTVCAYKSIQNSKFKVLDTSTLFFSMTC